MSQAKPLQARQIDFHLRGQKILSEVDFALDSNGVVGLLGPNGAGKTTLLRLLAGQLRPTSGEILVFGRGAVAGTAAGATRRQIALLSDKVVLYPDLSLLEQLKLTRSLYNATIDHTDVLLDALSLTEIADKPVGVLSRGQQQRAAIARTFVTDAAIILLDEPTEALDPAQLQAFVALLKAFARDKLILLSSHLLDQVERACSRALILHQGRLRANLDIDAASLEQRYFDITESAA